MKITVYILLCTDGGYYTGITKNFAVRKGQHDRGESKSTKDRRPLVLIWSTECTGYKDARLLEVRIKRTGARKFISSQASHEVYKKNSKEQ